MIIVLPKVTSFKWTGDELRDCNATIQDQTYNETISIKQTAQNLCWLGLVSLSFGHVV